MSRNKHAKKFPTVQVIIAIAVIAILAYVLAGNNANTTEETVEEVDNMKTKIELVTNKGTIAIELEDELAPITTTNFKKLVGEAFYDGLTFHRYVEGFVIQGGDPDGTGTGGSDERINLEVTPELTHKVGAVAMARSQDPNSARSQFYITLAPQPSLDGAYAVFGYVTEGMDVVQQLREGDTMDSIRIVE